MKSKRVRGDDPAAGNPSPFRFPLGGSTPSVRTGKDRTMTVTKADLAQDLYHRCGCSRGKAACVMETLLELVKSRLVTGDSVLISGFGKFCVVERKGRRGGNSAEGEELEPGARRAVAFRCSPVLRRKINGEEAQGKSL